MLTEEEVIKRGYNKVGKNIFEKGKNLFVMYYGDLKMINFLDEEALKQVVDLNELQKCRMKYDKMKEKRDKDTRKPASKLKHEGSSVVINKNDSPAFKNNVSKLRGTEQDLQRLMNAELQLDSIIEASRNKQKLGEGLLWHELEFKSKSGKSVISVEPSAELVDMITQDMGMIETEIIEFDTNILENPNTHKKHLTYYCVVKATDNHTNTSGLGAAEQIIDFDEIENKGRTFARTNAIRKAERNAKERLIPIPRKAMVTLIQSILNDHNKKRGKK